MKKNNTTEQILEKIYNYSLEEIMGERFGRYSKYIIQDRAIPDVRDGLKPVQRRILYAMYIGHNTYDKPYRKSAKTVGDVIGSFHPHGDTSIYDAMVRLSQDWKIKNPMIDMHGNNGSIDGDSPAAYRYTEARLSKISSELLKDIEKNTVKFAPNFDDTVMEPTVLPAKFPNLLVNGTTGISAGYATNIPPHNLGEIIDACIKRIDSPNCRVETILDIVKGPDFPTGGICLDKQGIINAFTTGRGKVVVRSKIHEEESKGKLSLVVTEIPYEVLKVNIVKKIDEIRIDKKLDGLLEVRDESDKEGLRIVIDIKKDANKDLILNYLYKNTELQTSYNYNMIAIVNRCPKLLSLIDIIDAYILHLKEVLTNRTKFDLDHAKLRFHIVEGLIKAISILDEVIRVIRASKNKSDAKENLVKEFDFTIEQAEAIVTLQLYRLTNTDITLLEDELKDLNLKIETYNKILTEEEALKYIMKKELKAIKDEYDVPRKTVIEDHLEEIKINEEDMITKEDVVVLITKDGYVKRTSKRSYNSSNDEPLLKENDYVLGLYELNTIDTVLIFTNLGNYLYLPVYDIPECKWKDLGKHISNIIPLMDDEKIVHSMFVSDFDEEKYITSFSKNGMIKRTLLNEFKAQRYSKPIKMMNLKDDDEIVSVTDSSDREVFVATSCGYGLWYDVSEVPVVGIKAAGVKSINLKDDYVVSGILFNAGSEYITILTDKGTGKRVKLLEFEKTSRAKRGILLMKVIKSNPSRVISVYIEDSKSLIGIVSDNYTKEVKITEIPIMDRYSNGSYVIKDRILSSYNIKGMETYNDKEKEDKTSVKVEKSAVSLKEIDDKLSSIDSIINDSYE